LVGENVDNGGEEEDDKDGHEDPHDKGGDE